MQGSWASWKGGGQPLAPGSSFWSVPAFFRVGKGPGGRREDDRNCCELVLFLSGTGGCFKQSFPLTVALRIAEAFSPAVFWMAVIASVFLHCRLQLLLPPLRRQVLNSILFPLSFHFSFQVVLLNRNFSHKWLPSELQTREFPHKLLFFFLYPGGMGPVTICIERGRTWAIGYAHNFFRISHLASDEVKILIQVLWPHSPKFGPPESYFQLKKLVFLFSFIV